MSIMSIKYSLIIKLIIQTKTKDEKKIIMLRLIYFQTYIPFYVYLVVINVISVVLDLWHRLSS
jgi:hypothetical protein